MTNIYPFTAYDLKDFDKDDVQDRGCKVIKYDDIINFDTVIDDYDFIVIRGKDKLDDFILNHKKIYDDANQQHKLVYDDAFNCYIKVSNMKLMSTIFAHEGVQSDKFNVQNLLIMITYWIGNGEVNKNTKQIMTYPSSSIIKIDVLSNIMSPTITINFPNKLKIIYFQGKSILRIKKTVKFQKMLFLQYVTYQTQNCFYHQNN